MAPTGPQRRCDNCDHAIPKSRRADAKYCSDKCSKAASARRRRARQRHDAAVAEGIVSELDRKRAASTEQGRDRLIDNMVAEGHMEALALGRMTQQQVARLHDVNRSQIKRAFDTYRSQQVVDAAAASWDRDPQVDWLLGVDLVRPDLTDTEACEAWATEAMVRFMAFEAEFFALPGGEPWLREDFHKEWIKAVLYAIATGGYLQILSPPRHGKSELLIHFCIWLICRNPDIRIMWVGPNIDISTDMVGSVSDSLANNERLVAATLPPGRYFAPPKRMPGAVWKRTEFRVEAQQSDRKGKTMVAVSRGKKILSKDTDLIVCDDIEDFDSTVQPSNRSNTRKWFGTQLDSRKEEHTAFIVIGSRQHPDDLYSYNLEDPNFVNIVNAAHDNSCRKDPDDYDVHIDCMLFPELRTYRWLMTKKMGGGAREESGVYEMVYQNDPQTEGFAIFVADEIDAAFNPGRGLGTAKLPKGNRLVAGLDPSATGFQAGFLWAVSPNPDWDDRTPNAGWGSLEVQDSRMLRHMIDIENRQGGGIDNALALFDRWLRAYGVRHWVVEENGFQKAIREDPRIKAWARENDVHLEGHVTGINKHDPLYGVGAMSRLFGDGLVDLPYADNAARQKSELFKRQAVRFTDDPTAQKRNTADVLMAAWFPQKTIRRWEKELVVARSRVQQVDSAYPSSYPSLSGFTTGMNEAPW